jgi:cell division protein FtsQ
LSQAKRDDRERRQRALALRRSLVAIVGLAVVFLVAWAVTAALNAPVFTIKRIAVTGTAHLSDADVVRLARIAQGTTLPRVDKRGAARRIAASPWVEKVRIDRDFPSTLIIEVTERRPAAIVDAGGSTMWVVSGDGLWLGPRSAEESGVPVIVDLQKVSPVSGGKVNEPVLRNAIAVAAGLGPELRAITRTISAPSIEKTALMTDSDVEVYVGEATDMARKDRIARAILKREKGRVVYINVRAVDSPTWRGLESSQ